MCGTTRVHVQHVALCNVIKVYPRRIFVVFSAFVEGVLIDCNADGVVISPL